MRVAQLPGSIRDPFTVPYEHSPGAFEERYGHWGLWPDFNENCVWKVKSGSVVQLLWQQLYWDGFAPPASLAAIASLGLNASEVRDGTAAEGFAAIFNAMADAGMTTKQKADKWNEILPHLGSPWISEQLDNDQYRGSGYAEPREASQGLLILDSAGTVAVRGPFPSPRQVMSVLVEHKPQSAAASSLEPFTVDMRFGCDDDGQNPACTVRLRCEHGADTGGQAWGWDEFSSMRFASKPTVGIVEAMLYLELLDSAGSVVESVLLASPIAARSGGQGQFGEIEYRVAVAAETDRLVVESLFGFSAQTGDYIDEGASGTELWNQLYAPTPTLTQFRPPLRHLFPPISGTFDVSRVAVALTRGAPHRVFVHHLPLENERRGTPDFFPIEQGEECAGGEDAAAVTKAGTKTLCTSWVPRCHVTHSPDGSCLSELDISIVGSPIFSGFNDSDLAALLQGSWTLSSVSRDGYPLSHNTFWINDDADVTQGTRRRSGIEVFGMVGAHWPVDPCYDDQYPIEVSLFFRAGVSAIASPPYPFPLPGINNPVTWWAMLRLRVPQNILDGATVTPQVNSTYDQRMRWGYQRQSWTLDTNVFATYLQLSLSKCELTLR